MLDLGQPLRQYVKEDDRLERMWGGSEPSTIGTSSESIVEKMEHIL
jgi:hypothetical protein